MKQLNSWERVKLSIEHRETDRVPVNFRAVPEINDKLVDELQLAGSDELMDVLGIDCRTVAPRYVGPADMDGGFGVGSTGRDFWGVVRRPVRNQFSAYQEIVHYPLAEMETVSEIENYNWPKVEWFDVSHIPDQIRQWDKNEKRWIVCFGGGAFESPWYMRSLDRFLVDLVERPELAEAIMRNVVDFYTGLTRKVYEACAGRLDMVITGGDIGTQRGMMLSPQLWRERVKPLSEQLIRTYASWGLKTFYHSCGAIRPVIGDFIEMSLDVLDPIQPLAEGMEPISIKRDFGDKLTLHGGLDVQELLPHRASQDVFDQTHRLIETMGVGGGYILAPAHAIQADTPIANVLAIYRAAGTLSNGQN